MSAPSCFPRVFVRSEAFDPHEFDALLGHDPSLGAVASFTGRCRDENGRLKALELEHYPGMAERQLHAIASQAMERWNAVKAMVIVHRHGVILPGEAIVHVTATSAHRDAAFDAVRFVMDYLKTDAPFWKKEHLADGSDGSWVAAKSSDDDARKRW